MAWIHGWEHEVGWLRIHNWWRVPGESLERESLVRLTRRKALNLLRPFWEADDIRRRSPSVEVPVPLNLPAQNLASESGKPLLSH
ncbi:hypothetical protein FCV25MIE_19455 [Fagus crenata]